MLCHQRVNGLYEKADKSKDEFEITRFNKVSLGRTYETNRQKISARKSGRQAIDNKLFSNIRNTKKGGISLLSKQ
ncbi:hypothetical protein BBN07_21810 [Vibrio parahaemolyticus]|nr:hypothetical protein AVR81_00890 [Vibrio parahaemolyticus]ODY90455.1 hypothetical protein BBM32_17460 [Vibrio parahaemolyticus]ODY97780.1 hypothetical protein BBM98_14365 [Vibrio parahaemolyticus]OEB62104.1 hypothetical protein BBN07_21810 [Vibrio parahaemolyticus]OEB76534.1 hypothetical protein BBN08_10345 [Vibrio parahaemolyticus]